MIFIVFEADHIALRHLFCDSVEAFQGGFGQLVDVSTMEGSGCQPLEHHIGVDVAIERVPEGARKGTRNVKAQLLPKANRSFVGGHDQVELHGAETELYSFGLRMLAH